MSTKFSGLVDYFENLARNHTSIQHTDTSKHFFRFELEEVLSGLPSEVRYPALILEGYRFGFDDDKSDNPVKKREGAFILIDHIPDPGDFSAIHEVWDELELIGDDILARIRYDKSNRTSPVRDFRLPSVSGTLLATEFGGLYGIRFTFEITNFFPYSLDETKWLDL